MLSEEYLASLPDLLVSMFRRLETETVTTICKRINDIGKVSSSDAYKLIELSRIGADVGAITNNIAATVQKSQAEIRDLLNAAAEAEYNGNKHLFDKLSANWLPFADNPMARELVDSMVDSIYVNITDITGLSASMSGTTGFVNTKGAWQSLSAYYQDTVDYAILQVRTGQTDFHSAMRKTIKNLADNGMCYFDKGTGGRAVGYDSGYIRRLDSSVRNAFMGGQQRLSRQIAEAQGLAFGADGYEITWHAGARPSHIDFAGKQFSTAEYQLRCIPLLNDYNCYHRAFPVVLGVSTPTYTTQELDTLNELDALEREFEGKKYNAYKASQMQRRLETAIRREKDRANAFKASGDKEAETLAKAKVTALNQRYKTFSAAMSVSPKPTRTSVSKYTRGKTVNRAP